MDLSSKAFVVVSKDNSHGIIFGKNSDRPSNEVQELIYEPPRCCSEGDLIKCSYTSVPATTSTNGVIISKSAWKWGCEMGANDQGVVGGCVPVKTVVQLKNDDTLIGEDILRLALERSKSAADAVEIIGKLLSEFGQGGASIEGDENSKYSSTFLIADRDEAWLVETAGKAWVAKKIDSGVRLVCGRLSIKTDFDKSCDNLKDVAQDCAQWNGEGELSWGEVFQKADDGNDLDDEAILNKYFSTVENFSVKDMMNVLRDKTSKICRSVSENVATTASQVSVLPKNAPGCHWFTATPDPSLSVFKPFIFTPNVRISSYTKSSESENRQHLLHDLHAKATAGGNNKVISLLQEMESNCLNEVESFISEYKPGQSLAEVDDLLKDIVETEVKFYK